MEKEIKLASATLLDGSMIYFDGTLAIATAIFTDEAMTTPAADGEYTLEDNSKIKVMGGAVEEIMAPEAPAAVEDLAEAPVAQALTAEEVSLMIDTRFAELMDEVTKMKELLAQKDETINQFKAEVNEKFSATPAAGSITKAEPKQDDKFSKVEARIREFAKNK